METKEIRQSVLRNYDLVANDYGRDYGIYIEDKDVYAAFDKQLPQYGTILDLGAGAGRTHAYYSKKGYNYIGMDFSPKMRQTAYQIHGEFPYIIDDMVNIKNYFENNSVDAVFAIYSLFHLPTEDLYTVVADVYDVLKDGGIFLLSYQQGIGEEFADEPYLGELGKKSLYMNYQTNEEMKNILRLRYDPLYRREKVENIVGAINNGNATTSYSIVKKRVRNFNRIV